MKTSGLFDHYNQASSSASSFVVQPNNNQQYLLDKQMQGSKNTSLDDTKLGFSGFNGVVYMFHTLGSPAGQPILQGGNKSVSRQQHEEVGSGLQALKKKVSFSGFSEEKFDTSLSLSPAEQPIAKRENNKVASQQQRAVLHDFEKKVCFGGLINVQELRLFGQSILIPKPEETEITKEKQETMLKKRKRINHQRVRRDVQPAYDGFPISKTLRETDVKTASRLLVPKILAKKYIIELLSEEQASKVEKGKGIRVAIKDLDTGNELSLKFKLSVKMKAYIFKSNWKKSFVKRRGLQSGDVVGMKFYPDETRFDFSLLRKANGETTS